MKWNIMIDQPPLQYVSTSRLKCLNVETLWVSSHVLTGKLGRLSSSFRLPIFKWSQAKSNSFEIFILHCLADCPTPKCFKCVQISVNNKFYLTLVPLQNTQQKHQAGWDVAKLQLQWEVPIRTFLPFCPATRTLDHKLVLHADITTLTHIQGHLKSSEPHLSRKSPGL